ncbi:hypothetical protein M5K25_026305 [Dendrobium thyrsiflorum]|uniref:Reverse transcriptase zinc-binding domain-containing protein n=1 Tax=Dendrobium thyrsiflorum TaxID=117978 RepID=A0ABD0TX22_DENTH
MALPLEDFPPLTNTSILGPSPAPLVTSYADNLSSPSLSAPFPVDFVPPAQKLAFVSEDLSEGAAIWSLSLVGYSLGQRPFYERLLSSMRKVWKLKGELSLLSMADARAPSRSKPPNPPVTPNVAPTVFIPPQIPFAENIPVLKTSSTSVPKLPSTSSDKERIIPNLNSPTKSISEGSSSSSGNTSLSSGPPPTSIPTSNKFEGLASDGTLPSDADPPDPSITNYSTLISGQETSSPTTSNLLSTVTWFKYIWHKKFALHFSVYAWMAILGKLKTYDVLLRRHIYTPSECSFCRVHQETHSHLLFECDFSFSVLSSLLPSVSAFLLRPNISQVFEFLDNTLQLHTLEKNFCFLVVCCSTYFIWRERNNRRFSGKWESPNTVTANIKHAIRLKVKRWKNSEHLFHKFPGFV